MTFDDKVRYQESHEWARKEGDLIVVGISDYAQESLGDVDALSKTGFYKRVGEILPDSL